MNYGLRFVTQETGIKTIPMEKKCKKAKWLSREGLQIAVKRREVKIKGEKERYKHLNAEFQTIARRDKKAFLSDQCKEVEENNTKGKTRSPVFPILLFFSISLHWSLRRLSYLLLLFSGTLHSVGHIFPVLLCL